MSKRVVVGCLAAGLVLVGAACSSSRQPQATAPTTTAASSSATIGIGSSTTSSSAPSSPSGQAAFFSPSRNINCEISYASGSATNSTFCETGSPAETATLAPDGSVKICGLRCEGNAGVGTPILAYGSSTGVGPFQCSSATSGVTCTAEGKGFEISRSGITPVGSPLVTLATGSYGGHVDSVSSDALRMTFTISTTGCNGVPSPGTWSVDLTGATFVANSEPATGQGQAVTVTRAQWVQMEQGQRAWTVVVASGQPLEVTDGPSC